MNLTSDVNVNKSIILWGATGQAKVLRECLEHFGYTIIALFDNDVMVQSPFNDIPIFYGEEGFLKWHSTVISSYSKIASLVAIGGSRGFDRHKIQNFIESYGIEITSVIHPTAFCASNVVIKKGSQILANSAVCVDVQMGEACIINSAASVDHECVLGDGVHVCPGSHVAGCVTIGDYSMIGTGAVVLPKIKIGHNVIVGAGSVVTKNIEDNTVVYGNPARYIRQNIFHEGKL